MNRSAPRESLRGETSRHLTEFSCRLTEDQAGGIILLGSLAIDQYARQVAAPPLPAIANEGEAYLSRAAFAALRDDHELTTVLPRGRRQLLLPDSGYPFDFWVQDHADRPIAFDAVAAEAVQIDGLCCAALEHLLIFKAEDCRNPRLGSKRVRHHADLLRILAMLEAPVLSRLIPTLSPECTAMIDQAPDDASADAFLAAATGGDIRILAERAQRHWTVIRGHLEH